MRAMVMRAPPQRSLRASTGFNQSWWLLLPYAGRLGLGAYQVWQLPR